ncbi:GCN5-related N-acetyltransferase, Putative acetyltransferase [Cupriavidus phytorum]|uniref:Acetyltransferase n=2 Tax=Cupriavidus TaxID=106589 RepID=A0A2W7R9B3_9BURK|nr:MULTISPECIES: N-acetyltransferase [Cupriavidus]PZX34722.1 putative acetyltransferase [Cupriavidus alkaliphilus]SOY71094.1 GCN5-related N-acetyltransferase, Putative acetyltransferase [Cupriavidus taiwanensis]
MTTFDALLIRSERPDDVHAITHVTQAAFAVATHSSGTEQLIITALRAAGQLEISLVAELSGNVVGHVAISPVEISDGSAQWYGLGPVSVLPAHQGIGVGSQLIRAALDRLKQSGAQGCVVLGEPAYYSRFGFAARSSLVLPGVPAEYFQAIAFGPHVPSGVVRYHESFEVKS